MLWDSLTSVTVYSKSTFDCESWKYIYYIYDPTIKQSFIGDAT